MADPAALDDCGLNDLYEYASVPGVGEADGWQHHGSIEESKQTILVFIDYKKTFALQYKENNKVIGSLGIEELDPDPVGIGRIGREIGYVLSKAYWGRGLMTETVEAVNRYWFDVLGYDYLTCGHFIQKTVPAGRSQRPDLYSSRNYILYNPNK